MGEQTVLDITSLFPKMTAFRFYAFDLTNQHSKFLYQIEGTELIKKKHLLSIPVVSLSCYRRESDTICIYLNKDEIHEKE